MKIHKGIKYTDEEIRVALRKVHLDKKIAIPNVRAARDMKDQFGKYLVGKRKSLDKLAVDFINNVWIKGIGT